MGSYHSLTPCVSTPGTIVDMKALDKIVRIDAEKMTLTAQAGLEMIEAANALRKLKLQFILNIEIGNMTLGRRRAATRRMPSTASGSGRSTRS